LETGFESSQRENSFPKAESAFGYVKELSAFLCCLMKTGKNYFQKKFAAAHGWLMNGSTRIISDMLKSSLEG